MGMGMGAGAATLTFIVAIGRADIATAVGGEAEEVEVVEEVCVGGGTGVT